MPHYDLVLLDADGTLLDFTRAQEFALSNMLADMEIPYNDGVLPVYDRINAEYWMKLERGEITKLELTVRRFADLLEYLGAPGDAAAMNERFIHYFAQTDFMLDGALETCAKLAPHCTLAIATNGIAHSQRKRLGKSPLAAHISHLVVSEEAGAAKPDKLFFDYAFAQCGFSDKSRVLMVGDSLTADILGGARYGIDTCWYNPVALPPPDDFEITYTIASLGELVGIVLG